MRHRNDKEYSEAYQLKLAIYEAVKAANDLLYGEEITKALKNANSVSEINKIMRKARLED